MLIAAVSGRGLAEAAVAAGWQPWVVDGFGDADTRALAAGMVEAPLDADLQFVREPLLEAARAVQDAAGPMPVVAGAGFERDPGVLEALVQNRCPAGANVAALRALLDIPGTFARLGRVAGITPAPTHADPPDADGRWLIKRAGSCGGHHVRPFDPDHPALRPGEYVQRFVEGVSHSAMFLAGSHGVRCCGHAAHLRWHPAPHAPFRYEGACTDAGLPPAFTRAVQDLAAAIAAELGLRGCFGIDFIRTRDDVPVLLDVNPRPPASLDLRPDAGHIFDAHVHACTTGELLYSGARSTAAAAHLVLYADAPWQVPEGFPWPAMAADRWIGGARVEPGMPLCTLRARSATLRGALHELADAYDLLRVAIESHAPDVLPLSTGITRVGES